MQQQAEDKPLSSTHSVPRALRRRLWIVVGAAALFGTTACAEGALRPEYDAWHQSVSALSLGPGGWIQTLNFVAFGVVVLTSVSVWRRLLAGGRGAIAVPTLTAFSGASLIICGTIPQDPAPGYDPAGLALAAPSLAGLLHLAAATVGAMSAIASLLIMAARFHGDAAWRGWSAYSTVGAIAMTVCVAIYAVWSTAPTGYAGTFERVALMNGPIWLLKFLLRLDAGTPFMRTERVVRKQ
jgi:hypothetical protein